MKLDLPLPLLLLGSLALPSLSQTSQPPGLEGIDDPEIAKKVIDYWSDYSCFILSDQSQPHVKEQCKEACFPGGVSAEVPSTDIVQSSQLCWLNGPEAEYRSGNPLTEEQLKENPRTGRHFTNQFARSLM